MLLHIKAYERNCPQHITPKYSPADLQDITQAKDRYITELEQEIEMLRVKLDAL